MGCSLHLPRRTAALGFLPAPTRRHPPKRGEKSTKPCEICALHNPTTSMLSTEVPTCPVCSRTEPLRGLGLFVRGFLPGRLDGALPIPQLRGSLVPSLPDPKSIASL